MATTTAPPAARPRPTSTAPKAAPLAGTGTLTRLMLRRDRVKLTAWIAGIWLFVYYVATALPEVFPTAEDLASGVAFYADPVGRLITGPAIGFDEPSLERLAAGAYGLYILVLVALMNVLLVVRHTRLEEQTGRAELVRANVVGRHAVLTAALAVAVAASLLTGLLATGTMVSVGEFAGAGSLLFGAAVAATGLAFAGVTAVAVQVTEYTRTAVGIAGIVLAAAFLVRGAGDMAEQGGTTLSWFSPLGWAQQTAPFVLDRWWPLALVLAFAAATAAAGYALSTRRDLGASLLAARLGSPVAPPWLGTPVGLAYRLQRASIIGWGIALVTTGLVLGSFSQVMLDSADDLPEAFFDVIASEDLLAGFMALATVMLALLLSVFALLAVVSLRTDETGRRTEPVLATAVGRPAWLGANLAVTAGAVVVISVLGGLATGTGAALVTGDGAHVGELLAAQLNQVPAVLLLLAVASALFGLLPRAVAATWAIVGYGMVVAFFGGLLDLEQAAYNLSPFEHPAAMPLEDFSAVPVLALTAIAVVVAALGLVGFRRRDLDTV